MTIPDPSHFDMTPGEEASLNEKNALKLYASEKAWKELCLLAQLHDPNSGHYAPLCNYQVLSIFNRMRLEFLRIDGRA